MRKVLVSHQSFSRPFFFLPFSQLTFRGEDGKKKGLVGEQKKKQNLSLVFFVIPFFFFYTYFLRFLVWRGFPLLFSLFPACITFFLSFWHLSTY